MNKLASVLGEFSRRLEAIGSVVIAGGAVRDALMERAPKDYDLFVLGSDFKKDAKAIADGVADLEALSPLTHHKSEPFLVQTVKWEGLVVQIMCSPHKSMAALVDSFDWNVAMFGFDGKLTQSADIEDIAEGKSLALHRVTYPLSTLRRGFRFSERFGMILERDDVFRLCRDDIATDAGADKAGVA